MWTCELSIYGLCPWQPWQILLSGTYSKNGVSNCRYFHLLSAANKRLCCAQEICRTSEKEACRKIRNVSLRFGPRSWLMAGRFAVKKNLTPQTAGDTLGSINQSINQPSTTQFHRVQVHSSARPAGQGISRDRNPNQTFQHSPNIERSPCSNHREPVPWSAKSGCVSSSPDTVHQWANVSAFGLRLYAPAAVAPPGP